MINQLGQRKHERVRVGGSVRMMVDSSAGLHMAAGHLLDMSEGGCAIVLRDRIEANVAARVQVELAGAAIWLPVATRWALCDSRGWRIGCRFDRPTEEKQRAVRALLWERRNLLKS